MRGNVEELVRPVVEAAGLELWELSFRKESGRLVLRVMVDRDGGVDLDTISETLKRGGDVAFTGFGKFSVSDRSARQGVNPQTGETIQIAASKVPKFSAGAKLKQTVKGG